MESPADMTIYPDLENVKVEPEDGKEKELKYDSNIGSILEMNGNKGGAQEVGMWMSKCTYSDLAVFSFMIYI